MTSGSYAQRRLLKDLQEVLQNPLPNVVGKPLDENLFVWHVNVRAADDNNQLSGGVFHLILEFPSDYPNLGPGILLGSPLPHPNVFPNGSGKWQLSLWDCIPGFKGWSSAYSAHSIFLQLQTFLLREDLQYNNCIVDQTRSVSLANGFSCSECPHKGIDPFPMFPTEYELEMSMKQRAKISVSRPPIQQVLSYLKQSKDIVQNSKPTVQNNQDNAIPAEVEDGWETVKYRKHNKQMWSQPTTNYPSEEKIKNLTAASSLKSFLKEEDMQNTLRDEHISKNSEVTDTQSTPCEEISTSPKVTSSTTKRSKTARRNRSRSMRRKAGQLQVSQDDKVKQVKMEVLEDDKLKKDDKKMGILGHIPSEALATIISRLSLRDLSSLSMTCHGLKEACEDGYVWKEILYQQFPATSLEAATMNDWKHAYILESSNIASGLQCFHSKVSFDKDVLGFPITYTINPRTKCVDYIQVNFHVLSQTAYEQQHVRTTADNDKFNLLLPLYINQDHFQRGLPLLAKVACELCPEIKSSRPKMDDMVLNFMPKLLNTMMVLLCGKGLSASDCVADGFCMLHRLFIALCDHFNLWKEVENRVLMFVQSEKARHKDICPNLGNFIALLTVCTSKETSWETVVRPWIGEHLDRSVIWVCKMHPHAVERLKVKPECGGVDDELINSCWDGHKVGLRLAVFFSGFLHMVARPPHVPLHKVTAAYDALYGMASLSMKSRIREFSKKVMAIDSWPAFFQGIGLQTPSKEYMTGLVRQSWWNSLKKGYHKNDTKFSDIQRHGVSKILLKGETSHLGMNSRVVMHEKWRFTNEIQYLDASCLVYDFDNRFIGVVDYSSRTEIPGIIHSGDLIDYSTSQGTHTIRISLSMLARTNAKEMYFTMSGWQGVRLRDIRLPFVQLLEEETATDLCEYHLEDKGLGECRSVIMCKIYRKDQGSSASWYVEAIGQLGDGAADEYEPIKRMIEERQASIFPSFGNQYQNRYHHLLVDPSV